MQPLLATLLPFAALLGGPSTPQPTGAYGSSSARGLQGRRLPHVQMLGGPTTPYPAGVYDSATARDYYGRRPRDVFTRALEIGWCSAGFAGKLLADVLSGEGLEGKNADARGKELTSLLVELGPAFIKIGQSASVRSDLLPPPYVKALTMLQEDVPAFSSSAAKQIIADDLPGVVFTGITQEPIAAASLGQVYKATFEGEPVAIKVQRPAIMERISLDMHLVRDWAAPLAVLIGAPGDIRGIADAWGAGLVEELDYNKEATNALAFNAQLEELAGGSLAGRVFAPRVIDAASSRRVLTTEWIDGERLDRASEASKDDIPRVASLAMNAYMYMMLDSGTLHCDPHPGNLLRTPDGRLCILDWGLVSTLDPDLRLTLIEHVAHLVARDYAKIPSDLVKLGFVPEGGEAAALDAGVVNLLTKTYSKRAEGGGFANFDVPALFDELRALSADAGANIFIIPPYFAYIAKAFATLEGIGLSVDPGYSILNDTLPYISRRIVTDPSPRTAGALETFVFGGEKDNKQARVIDAGRVGTLLDGMKRYSASAAANADGEVLAGAAGAGGAPASLAAVGGEARAEAAADVLLDLLREDTPASALVTEQLVLVLGARGRQAFSELREASGPGVGSGRSLLGTVVDPLGLFRQSGLMDTDERDRAALQAAAKLTDLARELLADSDAGVAGGAGEVEQQQLVRALAAKAWERRDDLSVVTRRIAAEALDQAAERLTRLPETK